MAKATKSAPSLRGGSLRAVVLWSASALIPALSSGCTATSGTYRLGAVRPTPASAALLTDEKPQIERGQARPVIDAIGWTIGIPSRVLLFDWRVERHAISHGTEKEIETYLAANDLHDVKVRLNQWDPIDEWDRLGKNERVGVGWRYTFGLVSWAGYTVFPGRIWGGDRYDPYTNTISLYSDHPAVALHEGGHAKDFAQRSYPGTYAAAYVLPIVPLYHESVATDDALEYLRQYGTLQEEQEAYRILYPAYGSYAGEAASSVLPGPDIVFGLGGIAAGHVVGSTRAAQIADERDAQGIPVEGNEIRLVDHEEFITP